MLEARGLLRSLPRLRLVAVDQRHAAGAARPAARRAGAHPAAGERQGPVPARRARAVAGVRWRCHMPRRCASGTTWRSSRPCRRCLPSGHPATRPGRISTTRSGRLSRARWHRKGWWTSSPQRGSKSPTSRSSPRSSWPRCVACHIRTSLWSCCASCSRVSCARRRERGTGTLLRRDAGADDPPLPESRHRGGPGDRGADPAGAGHAPGKRPRRDPRALGRRAGVL